MIVSSRTVSESSLSAPIAFRDVAWDDVPASPGVYAIYDRDEIIYVGMSGRVVQSDVSRMRWLQEFMTECAKKFQILVLTCRPEEYEVSGQQSFRSIDITEHIERSE